MQLRDEFTSSNDDSTEEIECLVTRYYEWNIVLSRSQQRVGCPFELSIILNNLDDVDDGESETVLLLRNEWEDE